MSNRGILIILACTIIAVQSYSKKENDLNWNEMMRIINSFKPGNTGNIKFDGCYFSDDRTELSGTKTPARIEFYSNGLMDYSLGAFLDSAHLANYYALPPSKQNFRFSNFGAYEVVGNTVNCYCYEPFQLRGARVKEFLTHYQGELAVDGSAIKDWRMVPPYPNAPEKYNLGMTGSQKLSSYTYKRFPAKTSLNQDAIWLMEFRK